MNKIISFILLTAGLISACTTTDLRPATPPEQLAESKGYTLGASVDYIQNYKLDGWNYLNAQAIIMRSSPSERYLITLRDYCPELSSTEAIASTSTNNSMRARFDAIIVRFNNSGSLTSMSNTRKCYIDKIYKMTKAAKTGTEK